MVFAVVGLVPVTAHAATPRCGWEAATIVGTEGDDRLVGTGKADVIVGLGGNDVILARGGWDTVCGGAGTDVIVSGWGGDFVMGQGGDDRLYGEYRRTDRNREIHSCSTGFGAATSYALCADTLVGGRGDDVILGGPNRDFLIGMDGHDEIRGQRGDDRLVGYAGRDNLRGGRGFDTVEYGDAPTGVHVDLADGTATGEGRDTLASVEAVNGSRYADTLYGDSGENWLAGIADGEDGGGDDVIVGRRGPDYLTGGGGNDRIWGGPGNDSLYGEDGADDWLNGGLARDTCFGETTRHCERTTWD
jgi:Ca2+-binding RTX toxin-like protein